MEGILCRKYRKLSLERKGKAVIFVGVLSVQESPDGGRKDGKDAALAGV